MADYYYDKQRMLKKNTSIVIDDSMQCESGLSNWKAFGILKDADCLKEDEEAVDQDL